ncbi:glycosyl transferase family 1 [Leptolyngbya sp. 'hensonii']|uniref:glycosyltransferase n=1 Tax=Leptolyngbya sp. 'hensonii' TaxID=1922337 RepID=UPI00094F89DA|nr:glycosyltransferase [Leptolyngbya sp. 'hensonii']OLP20481.1 glycosyl transferase family 1 [Leptolyngbya sp. 'hensonii']
MQRLKVLISAYACRPGEGSEPGIGWEIAREMAKHHQIWVLTRENNRPAITAELKKHPDIPLRVIFYDLPGSRIWRRGQGGVHLHYYLWQIGAYFAARQLHQTVQFDLVHHITYVRYAAPSFLSLLPIPFLWGPVGGGESAPQSFWKEFGWRARIYEGLRNAARWLGEHDPFVRMTARRSVLTWATTSDTADRLQTLQARNIQVLSQLGLSDLEISQLAQPCSRQEPPIRFISIGRLLHWKGFHLGLRAFAHADLPDSAEYWILGEGPEKLPLQKLAQELGIAHQIKFWGKQPRDEVLKHLKNCLALIHPSLHESGGMVCSEAMAAGIPVICLDLGGPAVQVTPETGFKIPAHNPEQAVQGLAQAMTTLAQNPDLRRSLGLSGQQRVRDLFRWSVKGQELANLYETVLKQSRYQAASLNPVQDGYPREDIG